MFRLILLCSLFALCAHAAEENPRLVEASYAPAPTNVTANRGLGQSALIARCRLAFAAPATMSLATVTSPTGQPLDFIKSEESVPAANQVFRVLRVNPAWKSLRTQWRVGAEGQKSFVVTVETLPPRELHWMNNLYPALTFATPGGGQGMLDHVWPANQKTSFYFGFRAPDDAPNASIEPLQVRAAGKVVTFQSSRPRQILVALDGESDPEELLPLEFEFAERGFAGDSPALSLDVELPDAARIVPDGDVEVWSAQSANALARVYPVTNDLNQRFAHAFVAGATDRPFQKWTIRSFTQFQGDPKPEDTWRNTNDSSRFDDGLYFRPDGSLRAPDESYGFLGSWGTQYRLEVERRREFRQDHRIRVPIARAGETLTFGPDEIGDETLIVRSVRFDAPARAGARGNVTILFELLTAFRDSEIETLFEQLQTPWGQNWMASSASPYWKEGVQQRGVFQFQSDIHLPNLPWVEIAFEHLEREAPDKSEEIVVRGPAQ